MENSDLSDFCLQLKKSHSEKPDQDFVQEVSDLSNSCLMHPRPIKQKGKTWMFNSDSKLSKSQLCSVSPVFSPQKKLTQSHLSVFSTSSYSNKFQDSNLDIEEIRNNYNQNPHEKSLENSIINSGESSQHSLDSYFSKLSQDLSELSFE